MDVPADEPTAAHGERSDADAAPGHEPLDLDAVLADLDAVERALEQLDAGTYVAPEA
jgi:hypothetical protein